jgi:hypothetical protein
MTVFHSEPRDQRRCPAHLPADRVICLDSVDRALIEVSVPGWDGDGRWRVPVLGRHAQLEPTLRRLVLANDSRAAAVPLEDVGDIDAEAVAAWIVDRFPDDHYPVAVLGSPHGGAVHLAAALAGAWLPTSFPVTLPWPDGEVGDVAGAADWGAVLACEIMERNPSVTVRQVHDPILRGPLCGATVTLRLRWRDLPAAYTEFLRDRCGASLLLRDMRTWPVMDGPPGFSFQLGRPANGLAHEDHRPDHPWFRQLLETAGAESWSAPARQSVVRYAETAGDPALDPQLRNVAAATGTAAHRVLYSTPDALSACVADLYRDRLGPTADLLIETGRLLDPAGVAARGLVPYWCETSSLRTFAATEAWLAGSEPFDDITVLPEPPGTECEAHAGLLHWRSLACFASARGRIDRTAAGRFPLLPMAPEHVARVLAETADPEPEPPPLPIAEVMDGLREVSVGMGLLIG